MRGRIWIAAMTAALVVASLLVFAWFARNPPAWPVPGIAPEDRNAKADGGSATRIVYLRQNWTPARSKQFSFTSQGSQILPYD